MASKVPFREAAHPERTSESMPSLQRCRAHLDASHYTTLGPRWTERMGLGAQNRAVGVALVTINPRDTHEERVPPALRLLAL